ncbi:hypothetical protein CGC21_11530 [Leishmania donovani]|uniref:Uncharacterized protein n=1 Tax=Leishmania donovani TaxID=5661 RepID=A0A504X0R3_LEIDO|nr:hypothetical protein CGC21_11530 [Leishmania donovani]
MGLVPSRESLYETPAAASQPRALPFISRAAENYMYKTNRTERVFGSGMALGSAGDAPRPTALLNGVPTAELAHKIMEADPNAVFIEDPAEATAAVAASRGSRRGSAKSTEVQCRGRDAGTLALETPAAEALRQGRVPYVYYYEHRVLPLTTEFFPSPDCVLFRQLWHARKQQNPRYHFQLDHTWSPGALTDPTAVYESFTELATRNMADIQAACLSAGQPVAKENLAQAQGQLQAAMRALNGGGVDMGHCAASSAGSQRTRVPFATREEFYSLVVLTTKESVIYDTNQELRAAVCGAATSGEAMRKRTDNAGKKPAAEESSKAERDRQRLRPVPCAVVLVRRCMPAHEYRYTYFVANNERHHKASAGAAGGSSRRRGPANACGTSEAHQPQQRESCSTLVCGASVRAAVEESQLVDQTPQGKVGDDELTVPWVQVSAPQAPLGLAEVRVVGMYGCWTVEEILRHTLFAPTVHTSSDPDRAAGTAATQNSPAREANVEKVLRRAAPHGVPSSTLVNTAFFEKQVGDKEQCHTYFALCRLFAHGMRRCILGDTSDKAAVTSTGGHAACEQTSADDEVPDEPSQQTGEALTERQRADPAWQDFIGALSGGASAMSAFGDLANCFLIRFSNIPQLQLCRQIRRMLTELQGIYPTPPSLEGFQAAQRQRNMTAMSKKIGASNGAGTGAAQGGDPSAHRSPPLKCRNGDEDTTAPPRLQGENEASLMDSTGAPPSAVAKTDAKQQHEGVTIAKRCGKPAVLPLSLDPEAIAERPHQLCERERLERDGFCCYASHGLVVFRLSRAAVARALDQLSFAPLHDSVEALCVTLTAAAPPPLTYRGELRPPARLRAHTMAAAATDASGSGEEVEDGDAKVRGGAVTSAEAHSPDALANMYNNAVRYSSSCATGFSMEPLWPIKLDSASWATHATALEDTPDELIGVLPRNSIEQRRGRLLPLRGVVMSEGAAAAANGACNGGAAHQGCSSGTSAPSQPHQQRHSQSALSSTPACALFQVDVYTVSSELDGMPFRELVEMMHEEQQQRWQSTACGASPESTLRLMIESVDAQGNVEPDSVLNWSPMSALGSLRWKRALAAAGRGYAGASVDRSDAAAEVADMRSMSTLPANVPGSQGVVSIFVREPERILHTGDRIRFSPHRGGSPNSGGRNSPMAASGSGTPHTRSRVGGNATSGSSQYGYWYVDDNLTTEDMILSWMRRVGGRARETCGTDTKWVRFPEPVLQVLLRFAHTCRQQPGGGWLVTGHALRPLHPADEELVEPDLLQNYPDILRTRRFRQWRFSHDGYVYFHGVTVRIPGSSPLPSHPPPAAAMTASAYHAAIRNCGEMTFGMCGRRSPRLAVVSSARAAFEPPQQQSVVPPQSSVMQYGEESPPSDVMPHCGSGGGGGGQYGAGAATGGPAYYANQAMYPIMGGSAGGSGSMPRKHYDPSMASQQLHPCLSVLPQHQQFSQHVPQHGSRRTDNTLLAYGLPPNVSGVVPPGEEVPNPPITVAGCGRDQEEATTSSSEPFMMHVASGDHQHQQHSRQQPHSSMLPPPSAPAPPPPPQQPMNLSLHGEGDRAGHAAERRTTDDYPPRRSPTTILAATAVTVSAAKPTPQTSIIQTLRGTHATAGHRAPPVAAFAPEVIDPSPLSSSGGNKCPVMTPKDRTAEGADSGADIVNDCSTSSQPTRARAVPVCNPDFSSTTQQMRVGAQQVYQQPQQQQQPLQQAQAPPPRSPQLASGPGSFRDTITTDVIEADSITVRVMQRKPSMARQSSYNGATGGAAASGYRTSSGAFGNSSNVAGDGGAPDAFSPSSMGYGAMGVSPSGGLESMRDEANSVHRKTGGVSANDSRAAPELRSYRLSQVRTSTTGQQVASGRSTAAAFAVPQLQRQSSMMGSSLPTQRTSQRISHNPYTTAGALCVTPLATAAGLSIHSQGGAGGCKAGSNGQHDSFADALDNRYGSASDFNASVSAFPLSLAHNANGTTHGTYYSRCAGDPAGFRSSPATSQRPSLYPSQRATGDVDDSSRADRQQEGRHESYASFYEGAEGAPASTHYSDIYHNAAADGTTQGFFFSMGEYEETGNSAEELYGGSPDYQYQSSPGCALQLEGRPDKGAGRGGSAYGGVPLPTRNVHYQQLQQRNVGGGKACNGGAYEDSTPTSALPHSSQPHQQHAYSPTSAAFQRH